ncbi:MAG: glycosyltransferase family 4 protein [Nitrososphaerota archaeon]
MKVMLITFEYPPNISGGIGSFNYELAKGFSKNDIDVTVIAGGNSDFILKDRGIKAYFLKTPTLRPREFYFQIYNAERIANIVEKEKPNIIQLNSSFNPFLKILKRGGSLNSAIVQVFHGSPGPFSRLYEDLRNLFIYDVIWTLALQVHARLSRHIVDSLEYVDAVVHVAKHVMYYNLRYSRLSEKLREKINVVIYPSINVEYLEQLRCKTSLKRQKSLIFGARLVPYKGITYLLKAFKLAWKEDKEISLHICGDGPLRLQVLQMIKDMQHQGISNIHYHGKLVREAFLKAVARSHVLVHPSLYEAASLTLIESSLLGTPVLAHKAPYSEEFVEKLNTGITVNTRDVEKFASAIMSMLYDEKLMYRMTKSLKSIYKLFNMDEVVGKYMELYQRLI